MRVSDPSDGPHAFFFFLGPSNCRCLSARAPSVARHIHGHKGIIPPSPLHPKRGLGLAARWQKGGPEGSPRYCVLTFDAYMQSEADN